MFGRRKLMFKVKLKLGLQDDIIEIPFIFFSAFERVALEPDDKMGIGRISAEGFALCAYIVPVSAECFGKSTFCLTNHFVPQPDNFAPGNFLVWSTYWSITSQNLLRSARTFFTRYVRRRFWKFLEGPCALRARARLPITVRFCAKQSAILWR